MTTFDIITVILAHTWPVLLTTAIVVTGLVAGRAAAARSWTRGAKLVHIAAPPTVDPKSTSLLWTHLAGVSRPWWKRIMFGQPHVAFEYAFTGRDLDIRIWVPSCVPTGLVQHAVEAAWPGSATRITEPEPSNPRLAIGGVIRLPRVLPPLVPVRTDAPADPVRAIVAAGPSPSPGDMATVQILARPAYRNGTRSGHSGRGWGIILLDLFTPGPAHRNHRPHTTPTAHTRHQAGPAFAIAVRYVVTATGDSPRTGQRLRNRSHAIAAAITAVAGTSGVKRHRLHHPLATIERRRLIGGHYLVLDEITALAHLPSDEIVPALNRAGARAVAPATGVVSGGRSTKPLGTAAVGGRKVALSAADARYHVHAIGPTGVGKSTFLLNMVLSDIKAHRGCVVIDPKGDLVTDILDRLNPDTVAGRLVVIDPDQPAPHTGLNPLAGADHDLVVDNLVSICRRIFERHWGPRADDILRNGLLTLLRIPDATLEHLPSLLSKKEFRSKYVAGIDEPWGLGGFWEWYDSLTPGVQAQAAGPVLSRIRALLGRQFVRATIGAPATTIDMGHILGRGGILLARLPKGALGDDTARLLGSIIVAKVWQAATARTGIPEPQRRDAAIYIDEAHNFLNLPQSVDDILAEARGYRLSMVLAHQYVAQLPRELQFALSANARTKVFFNTSPEDARILSRHTLPHLTEHDLSHLDAYQAACRTITDGKEQPAFTLATLPPPEPIGRADDVRRAAIRQPEPKPDKDTNDPKDDADGGGA